MAQNSRKSKSQTQSRRSSRDMDMDTDMEMDSQDYSAEQDLDIEDATQSRSARGGQQGKGRSQRSMQSRDEQPDIVSSITSSVGPAFQEARKYVDGHPVRAAAIGAVAGGLLMTLFSTEKGRQFVRMAYDYANPMVARYARDYVTRAAGDLAENAISQH